MRRKNRSFVVQLDIPPRATEDEVLDYLEDAVKTWAGAMCPGDEENEPDAMFELDRDSVRVGLSKGSSYYRSRGKARLAGVKS
jgi:hypothetical protein